MIRPTGVLTRRIGASRKSMQDRFSESEVSVNPYPALSVDRTIMTKTICRPERKGKTAAKPVKVEAHTRSKPKPIKGGC